MNKDERMRHLVRNLGKSKDIRWGLSKEEEDELRDYWRQLLPKAPPELEEMLLQQMRCLSEDTEAGEERRAIMNLFMWHEAVSASDLRRLCSAEAEARIAEMRAAGMPLESWEERRPDGTVETIYSAGTPEVVRAMRMVFGTEQDEKGLKRVM